MTEQHIFHVIHEGRDFEISAAVLDRGPEWVLCLHGIQSNNELFEGLIQQEALSAFSIVAPDFVGFGGSAKPSDFSYDVQDQAKIIESLVREMDIKSLHIIGHSLGGMVGTLLLNPLAQIVRSFSNLEGNFVLEDCGLSLDVSKRPLTTFCSNHEFEAIKSGLRSSSQAGSIDRARWLDDIPDFAFHRTCDSIVQWSERGELLQMYLDSKCRKLFIYGSENSGKVSRLPMSMASIEIPDSGHFMLQSNPGETYQAVREFLLNPGS